LIFNRVLNAAKPGHSADPVSAVTKKAKHCWALITLLALSVAQHPIKGPVKTIDKINNIARCNLIAEKYHQMAFRLARWRCSCTLFGNPYTLKLFCLYHLILTTQKVFIDCEIRENQQCGLPEQNIEQIHLALDCKWPRAVLIGTQIE
jgi:hypothetical protein